VLFREGAGTSFLFFTPGLVTFAVAFAGLAAGLVVLASFAFSSEAFFF